MSYVIQEEDVEQTFPTILTVKTTTECDDLVNALLTQDYLPSELGANNDEEANADCEADVAASAIIDHMTIR